MQDFWLPLCQHRKHLQPLNPNSFSVPLLLTFLWPNHQLPPPARQQAHRQREHHPSPFFSLFESQPLICQTSLVHFPWMRGILLSLFPHLLPLHLQFTPSTCSTLTPVTIISGIYSVSYSLVVVLCSSPSYAWISILLFFTIIHLLPNFYHYLSIFIVWLVDN